VYLVFLSLCCIKLWPSLSLQRCAALMTSAAPETETPSPMSEAHPSTKDPWTVDSGTSTDKRPITTKEIKHCIEYLHRRRGPFTKLT